MCHIRHRHKWSFPDCTHYVKLLMLRAKITISDINEQLLVLRPQFRNSYRTPFTISHTVPRIKCSPKGLLRTEYLLLILIFCAAVCDAVMLIPI